MHIQMKRKTWIIREAAQSRKCCWSIAYRLIALDTYFAAHILGWRHLSDTLAYLQSDRRQEEVVRTQQPRISQRSGLTYGGEGDKEENSVSFQWNPTIHPIFLPRPFLPLFPSTVLCFVRAFLILLFPCLLWPCCGCPHSLRGACDAFNFLTFDCGVFLTEDPVWLKHQPGAS